MTDTNDASVRAALAFVARAEYARAVKAKEIAAKALAKAEKQIDE